VAELLTGRAPEFDDDPSLAVELIVDAAGAVRAVERPGFRW
jgi:hypothetical protein